MLLHFFIYIHAHFYFFFSTFLAYLHSSTFFISSFQLSLCTFKFCTCITYDWVVIPASPILVRLLFCTFIFISLPLTQYTHTWACGRRWLGRQHVHTHLLFCTFTFRTLEWRTLALITPVSPQSRTCTFYFLLHLV